MCVSSKLKAVIGTRRTKRASLLHFGQGSGGKVFGDRGNCSLMSEVPVERDWNISKMAFCRQHLFFPARLALVSNRVPCRSYQFESPLVLWISQLAASLRHSAANSRYSVTVLSMVPSREPLIRPVGESVCLLTQVQRATAYFKSGR